MGSESGGSKGHQGLQGLGNERGGQESTPNQMAYSVVCLAAVSTISSSLDM